MSKLNWLKTGYAIFLMWAVTAIVSPAQTFTTLHDFIGYPTDGANPEAGLVQAIDGGLYGTTGWGGANGTYDGSIFRITPSGSLTLVYSFCSQANCTDGAFPAAGLIQGRDGNFYGTTANGGANGLGTAFKVTPEGTLTTLYNFCSENECADGMYPYAALIQASDGNFTGPPSAMAVGVPAARSSKSHRVER
jgi:uncharacterized repeat protein (TIGR03803 family)